VIERLLRERRSVRRFQERPVPRELVLRLIEAAVLAPSASNKQPWKFLLVESRATIAHMAGAVRQATARIAEHIPADSRAAFAAYGDYFTRFEAAPLVIIPIYKSLGVLSHLVDASLPAADAAAIAELEQSSGLIGSSLALGNLLLVAHELGLGASGMTGPLVARQELKRLLDVPESWEIVALVPVGYPAEEPAATERKPASRVIRWIT
jgi:nitroreductase